MNGIVDLCLFFLASLASTEQHEACFICVLLRKRVTVGIIDLSQTEGKKKSAQILRQKITYCFPFMVSFFLFLSCRRQSLEDVDSNKKRKNRRGRGVFFVCLFLSFFLSFFLSPFFFFSSYKDASAKTSFREQRHWHELCSFHGISFFRARALLCRCRAGAFFVWW